jgi:hypothetical protein
VQLCGMRAPPFAHGKTLVVARMVEDDDDGFVWPQLVQEALEEGHEGGFVFARAQGIHQASTGVVQRAPKTAHFWSAPAAGILIGCPFLRPTCARWGWVWIAHSST